MNKKFSLAVFALLICFATKAWAYDFSAKCESGQTLYYNITSSTQPYTVEVTKMEAEQDDDDYYGLIFIDITIPSTVTHNGIKYSVTSIGNYAFNGCSGLTSVTIPNSVTRIGKEAFKSCESLTKIAISNYVTSIGVGAFWGCGNLTSMSVGKNNPNYDSRNNCNAIIETATNTLIYGCRNTTIPNSVTGIDKYAFSACQGMTTITIPNSVKSIGDGAFAYSSLTSINIPNSVSRIGDETFAICERLTSINIPNSVTSIGKIAFSNCNGLTSVIIPNSVTSIGEGAFDGCENLTSINIPNSVTIIESKTFAECYSLKSITIPGSITSINDSAFWGCIELESITIPQSVNSIGTNAFFWCDSIKNITIESDADFSDASLHVIKDGIKYAVIDKKSVKLTPNLKETVEMVIDPYSEDPDIPDYMEAVVVRNICPGRLDSLATITIPETITFGQTFTVTSIGDSAFQYCSYIESITIPNTVTSIGEKAFSNCDRLASITIPNSVTKIGDDAFQGVKNVTYSGTAAGSPWGAYIHNGYVDGYLIYSDETKTTLIGCSSFATDVIIPNSVTRIDGYAFYKCQNLKTLTLPNSVTSIGNKAFHECFSLSDIYYTGNVTQWCGITFGDNYSNPISVARNLYFNNNLVTELDIPNTITEIKPYAFYGCSNLTSVKFGNSVTSIGAGAFNSCKLTSLSITKSVKFIGNAAFGWCNLPDEQVEKIKKINENAFDYFVW